MPANGLSPLNQPLWRHPAFRWTLLCFAALALSALFWWTPLETLLFDAESGVAGLFGLSRLVRVSAVLLPLVGFAGGVLASFSPCILPLVPLNLAYVGANEATGWRSLALSLRFVAGAAAVLSLLGIFGSLAGLVLVEYRGPTLVLVGGLLLYFGLIVLEVLPEPLGGRRSALGRKLGPFGAGAAFSLVTTPCSSPILAAVLAAASASTVPGLAVVTMISFSLGYTLLVLLGGVFGGGLVAWAKALHLAAPRAVAAALLVASGGAFVWAGLSWF